MLQLKKISECFDLKVFTDSGEYFGDVEEAILLGNKITGWRIRATRSSFLSRILGNAKGVIVPHNLVKNISDVMIINKQAVPPFEGNEE